MINIDEYIFLTEAEFDDLDDNAKWKYIEHIKKLIDELSIKAEKNCEKCEKHLITPEDINIDMFFEDWRECADNCDECKKEDQVFMCEVEFQLMSHLAEAITRLTSKVNILTKLYLEQDKDGSKFIEDFVKEQKSKKEAHTELYQ